MSDPSSPITSTLGSHHDPRALLASPTLDLNTFSSSPAADSPTEAAEPRFRRYQSTSSPRLVCPFNTRSQHTPCSSAEDSLMGVFAPHPISQPSLSGDSQRVVTGRFARISLAFTRPHSTMIGSLQAPPCTTSLSVSGPHAPVAAFTMQSAIDVRLHCNQQSVRLTGTKRKSQTYRPAVSARADSQCRRLFSQSSRGGSFACTGTGNASDQLTVTLSLPHSPGLMRVRSHHTRAPGSLERTLHFALATNRTSSLSLSLSLFLSLSLSFSLSESLSLSPPLSQYINRRTAQYTPAGALLGQELSRSGARQIIPWPAKSSYGPPNHGRHPLDAARGPERGAPRARLLQRLSPLIRK